jgi:4-hydroxybenzoate polyprenyltransferase
VARSRAGALLLAAHPLPSAAVTAFAAATGAAAGLGAGRAVLLAAAIFVGQLSIGWANDYVDAGRDRAVGRPDKPLARRALPDGVVGVAAGVALLADVPLSLALGARAGAAHLAAVGSAWMYDALLKPTVASFVPYAVSFGLLPVVIAGTLPGGPRPRLLIVVAGALMGLAAHFANTVGDTADDARTGVRGLPQRVGPAQSLAAAATLVAAAAGCLVAVTDAAVSALAAAAVDVVALAVVARVATRSGSRRLAFRALLLAVAVLIAAFVGSGGDRLVG